MNADWTFRSGIPSWGFIAAHMTHPIAPAGTPDAPRCGFSRKVAAAVQATGHPFGFFNILTDEAVRQARSLLYICCLAAHATFKQEFGTLNQRIRSLRSRWSSGLKIHLSPPDTPLSGLC